MKIKKTFTLLVAVFLISVWARAQTPRINIPVKGLYPEGTAYNPKNNLFYVGSVIDGTIGTVDQQGNYKKFYEDKSLKSTYGMKVNVQQNLLWVCVCDGNYSKFSDSSTFRKMARLISLDLSSGKKMADINLAPLFEGKHFVNDLAFDDKGNIYITESLSPVIYKVDAAGKASIFTQSNLFKTDNDVALNGIVYNPDGYLIVDNDLQGALYKIPVSNPLNITKVKIKQFFPGCDGLVLTPDNKLVLIQNKGADKIFQLISSDGWRSAQVEAATSSNDRFQVPTSGVVANGKLYVLNAKLDELSNPVKKPSPSFSLQLVVFKPVK